MGHLPELIYDLGLILITGAIGTPEKLNAFIGQTDNAKQK